MIVLDTSVFLELLQPHARRHQEVLAWYGRELDQLVTTPLIVAELDYMLHRHGTEGRMQTFYANLENRAIQVEGWPAALSATLAVARSRPDIGLTDASLVSLAAHLETTQIATLDERHFRTLTPLTGEERFRLLPADAN